jgi:hypothetical protein
MSQATQAPTVTNLVPGVTGGNHPRGTKTRKISARLNPASHVSRPVVESKARRRSARVLSTTSPPGAEGMAASP